MIKLGSLNRWLALPVDAVITLPGEGIRRVLLGVNSPGVSPLYTVSDDGEVEFLASPDRLEEIEFYHEGDLKITTKSPDVFLLTSESLPMHFEVPDPETFTEIATRAARNPEMERVMYMAQVNMERRIAQIAAGVEERIGDAFTAGQRAATGRPSGENPAVDGGKPAKPGPKPGKPAPADSEDPAAEPVEGDGD